MAANVREYNEIDRASVVELTEELQDYLKSIDPLNRLIRAPEYGEWYAARMLQEVAQKSGRIFVAVLTNKVVGYITGVIDAESPDVGIGYVPTKAGRITELVVAKKERSLGIGHLLMTALEAFFSGAKCDIVRVEVFTPNGGAKRFYEQFGYGCRTHDMVRVLSSKNKN